MKRPCLVLLTLWLVLLSTAGRAEAPLGLGTLLGRDYAGWEEVLGAPLRSGAYGCREYRKPGVAKLFLVQAGTPDEPMMNAVAVLPKGGPNTWRSAFQRLGLSASGLNAAWTGGILNLSRGAEFYCWVPGAKGRHATESSVSFDTALEIFRGEPNRSPFGLLLIEAPIAATVLDLRPLLAEGPEAYEKLLGKPASAVTDGTQELRTYAKEGLTRLQVRFDGKPQAAELQIGFSRYRCKSWQSALRRVGLASLQVTATKEEFTYSLAGGLPEGWHGTWVPNNPEYPDEHTLILTHRPAPE